MDGSEVDPRFDLGSIDTPKIPNNEERSHIWEASIVRIRYTRFFNATNSRLYQSASERVRAFHKGVDDCFFTLRDLDVIQLLQLNSNLKICQVHNGLGKKIISKND